MAKVRGAAEWRVLTRRDLGGFDGYATRAVLYAMEHGGVGRITNRGHAFLRAPDGRTMSVSPSSRKSKQVIEINVRKLFGNGEEISNSEEEEVVTETTPQEKEDATTATVSMIEPTIHCTVKGCPAVFVTEGARYSHLYSAHHVCKEPGCMFAHDRTQSVAAHHRIVHEGVRPRSVGAQKAARARMEGLAEAQRLAAERLEAERLEEAQQPAEEEPEPEPQFGEPEPEDAEVVIAGAVRRILTDTREAVEAMEVMAAKYRERVNELEQENKELRTALESVRSTIQSLLTTE